MARGRAQGEATEVCNLVGLPPVAPGHYFSGKRTSRVKKVNPRRPLRESVRLEEVRHNKLEPEEKEKEHEIIKKAVCMNDAVLM